MSLLRKVKMAKLKKEKQRLKNEKKLLKKLKKQRIKAEKEEKTLKAIKREKARIAKAREIRFEQRKKRIASLEKTIKKIDRATFQFLPKTKRKKKNKR